MITILREYVWKYGLYFEQKEWEITLVVAINLLSQQWDIRLLTKVREEAGITLDMPSNWIEAL